MDATRSFVVSIMTDPEGSATTAIPVPFDPKEVFGKARAPVVVEIGPHTFRSTVWIKGGVRFVPLNKSNREAAGVRGGQRVRVTLTLDDKPRTITPPRDLTAALRAAGAEVLAAWKAMSYSHHREYIEAIEEAKRPETRAKRIAGCVDMMRARASGSGGGGRAAER